MYKPFILVAHREPKEEITISTKKLRLICDFYGIPTVVFSDRITEEDLQKMIENHGTAGNLLSKYHLAIVLIKDVIKKLDKETKKCPADIMNYFRSDTHWINIERRYNVHTAVGQIGPSLYRKLALFVLNHCKTRRRRNDRKTQI